MRLVMVDADERFPQGKRDGLRGLEPDQQARSAIPALAWRQRHRVVPAGTPASRKRGLRDGHQIPQMFARGQFRHHAAVFGVQFDLRRNGIGQNFAVAHHGGAGFVAGSFNGQNVMSLEFKLSNLFEFVQCRIQRCNA